MDKLLKDKHILVTGGAGFIGSNLTEALLLKGAKVRVFDNLETGRKSNIEEFFSNPNFEFFQGDIREVDDCYKALEGIDAVSHQAALGSVPRSIEFPQNTHAVNATGFLNMIHACKERGIKRFVYASSSSVYGDSKESPKVEGVEGNLLSPYAITKSFNEKYGAVYKDLHGIQSIGLRYFNVFGPKQDPNGVYAAAIPKFIDKMIKGEKIIVNGDGEQTRDFTFVQNAVNANLLGLTTRNSEAYGRVFNVACGASYSLNYVISEIRDRLKEQGVYNEETIVDHGPDRKGDIRDSLASIESIKKILDYNDPVSFEDGIRILCSIVP